MPFQASFKPYEMSLKLIKYFVRDVHIDKNIFHHLKLEIALAIPALNK